MHKRIIICCDGTWNEPENIKDKVKAPTNVLKMVRALAPRDTKLGVEQITFYDRGVGTGSIGFADRLIGGGLGAGISANIQNSYRFLANNYVAGDEIYLFGFSRGAYTARSLAGMIAALGLLCKSDLRYLPEAYAYYHTEPEQRAESEFHSLLQNLRKQTPNIKFIGVWDTVGALGVPTPILGKVQQMVGKFWPAVRVGFHDCNLSAKVEHAYQALAIDERRGPFKPAIWDETQDQLSIQQVWFAGVHSNIGGGYPDCGLSDIALRWLINRGIECGLKLDSEYLADYIDDDPLGLLEDSYSWGYEALEKLRVEPYVREIGLHLDAGEMIHESVLRRLQQGTPQYRPANLAEDGNEPVIEGIEKQQTVVIGARRVPVFFERENLRIRVDDSQATAALSGGNPIPCKIIDISQGLGARLRITGTSLNIGDLLRLDSKLTGSRNSTVVWCHSDEVGVRFAA